MRIDGPKVAAVAQRRDSMTFEGVSKPKTLGDIFVHAAMKERMEKTSQAEMAKAEKLSVLREQIDSGTYRVDFNKLSERILEEELYRAKP